MPLLSVVVPTHNRGDYAISCIESTLRFPSQEIQLVVTDTSSDGHLYNYLHDGQCTFLSDSRFIYRKIDERSNLTKNHNDALALAEGKYVCVIGDDDCITGAAIDAARWASDNSIAVVSQTVSANYAWPDFRSRFVGKRHASRLYVPKTVQPGRWRESAADLSQALSSALQGTANLPRCYHGVVRRDIVETIRERTGAYFHGSSPDMSGAVSLACLVDRYFEVETPLTIPGASGGSNSGRSAMNTHKGDLASDTQTSSFTDSGWTLGVPRFFSVETVWAHAGLEALTKLRPDLLGDFDYARLIALCTIRHPDYREATKVAEIEVNTILGRNMATVIGRRIRQERWARRMYLLRRATMPTAAYGRRYIGHLATIAEASRCYENYALAKGIAFSESGRLTAD